MNVFDNGGVSSVTDISPLQTRVGGPLSLDAWTRPKAVIDKSLIHGLFTASVPREVWKEVVNDVETAGTASFTNCSSVFGLAHVSSGPALNDVTCLDTFRSPRYEPNRGHLYSS